MALLRRQQPAPNQISNVSGAAQISFGHEARSNITSKIWAAGGSLGFNFDLAERMLSTSRDGIQLASYRYDGLGRRIKSTLMQKEAKFLRAEGGSPKNSFRRQAATKTREGRTFSIERATEKSRYQCWANKG